jgi:hypothetical protein
MPSPQLFDLIPFLISFGLSKNKKPRKMKRFYGVLVSFEFFSAESEGFEPPEPRGSTVFKTAAIDHSANSPRQK